MAPEIQGILPRRENFRGRLRFHGPYREETTGESPSQGRARAGAKGSRVDYAKMGFRRRCPETGTPAPVVAVSIRSASSRTHPGRVLLSVRRLLHRRVE